MNDLSGPPADPGTEKRIILALALTVVVIAITQPFLAKYAKQQAPVEPTPITQPAQQPASSPAPAAPAAKPAAPTTVPTKQAAAESDVVIENDLYRITFTNRGAQVKSWILKQYRDEKGQPLELVHANAAAQHGYPLSLWTWDAGLRDRLNSGLYVASRAGTVSAPGVLSFEFSDGTTSARKTFSFDHTYVVRVETSVMQNGALVAALPAWPAGFGDQTVLPSYMAARVDYETPQASLFRSTTVVRLAAPKVSGGNTVRGPFYWAAATDQYFAATFLPDDPDNAALVTLSHAIKIPKPSGLTASDPNATIDVPVVGAAVGSLKGTTTERIFVGPKALHALDAVHAAPIVNGQGTGPDIERLVDFGTYFGWLARPLFLWLEWTHDHWVPNWGWSIVALTLIINAVLFPLRVSSMKSALKMQRVQPQIKAIQAKYSKYKMNDPKRAEMNQELSALYKKENINPAGGCLPLLLQMPFLIAFYSMLGVAIELRQAPWAWIHDLSTPDPWHVLPILIILSMVWLQRMTPQAGMDPVQAKMMMIMMPVMFGMISWNLASGLCLYYGIANVLAIVQQYWINNSGFGKEMRAAMEKRNQRKK